MTSKTFLLASEWSSLLARLPPFWRFRLQIDSFYHSLLQVVPETYYSVAFDDGTFCDNHDPEEVKYEQGAELAINTEVENKLGAQF